MDRPVEPPEANRRVVPESEVSGFEIFDKRGTIGSRLEASD